MKRLSSIVVLFCFVFFVVSVSHVSAVSNQVASVLQSTANQYGVPANLVKAIAQHESGWNQSARGSSGEIGVMQILPSTADLLNASAHTHYNPYTLSGNIALGTMYLRNLWRSFHGNLVKVISAYNRGEWTVSHRGITNSPYVASVLSLMRRY